MKRVADILPFVMAARVLVAAFYGTNREKSRAFGFPFDDQCGYDITKRDSFSNGVIGTAH